MLIIAYPAEKVGNIFVKKFTNEGSNSRNFESHSSPIAKLKFNSKGSFLAAASSTGQIIKIFETENYTVSYEFKRGSEPAEISNMCFSKDDNYFLCSSSRCTVHIFSINNESKQNPVRLYEKFVSLVKNNDYMVKESSYAQLRVNLPSICSFYRTSHIIAVNTNGCVVGKMKSKKGGDCEITKSVQFT